MNNFVTTNTIIITIVTNHHHLLKVSMMLGTLLDPQEIDELMEEADVVGQV